MSEPVLADAQFTTTRLLRPFDGFIDIYDGTSALKPIMMTEDGGMLDPSSGNSTAATQDGYVPYLVKGNEVPLGARVLLWLPVFAANRMEYIYRWSFTWRLRNLREYRLSRKPWHIPKQGLGFGDNVLIPAASHTVTYVQPEPPVGSRIAQHMVAEDLQTVTVADLSELGAPWVVDNAGIAHLGVVSQGLALGGGAAASYVCVELQSLGDELLVGLSRGSTNTVGANWNFATDDEQIARFTLSSDVGVYLMTGTAP